MTTNLDTRNLSLKDVHHLFNFEEQLHGTFTPLLSLEPLTTLEENIAEIHVEDEDTNIKGRMDILAVHKAKAKTTVTPFWILVIESKNSEIEALTGLPQLLAYAYKSLEQQEAFWGLTTNGLRYQFVYIQRGNTPNYQLLPELNLIDSERTTQLLQVLKAIRQLDDVVSPV